MKVTIERREGRVTMWSYRAVVTVGNKTAEGPWEYTQKQARLSVPALKRSLMPSPEESEAIMRAESRRRCEFARTEIIHDRRVRLGPT